MTNLNILNNSKNNDFIELAQGNLYGLFSWGEFDQVCQYISNSKNHNWYIYEIDKPLPDNASTDAQIKQFINSLNANIHEQYSREHCGIAFVDSIDKPGGN